MKNMIGFSFWAIVLTIASLVWGGALFAQTEIINEEGSVEFYGKDIALIQDINGDGHDDAVVGINGPLNGGFKVLSGANGSSLITVFNFILDQQFEGLGKTLTVLPDLNANGFETICVGAYKNNALNNPHGRIAIYHVTSGSTTQSGWTQEGTEDNGLFGSAIASVPDVNGDGVADVAVGAPGLESSSLTGKVYLFSGADGSLLFTKSGEYAGDRFGFAVAGLSDLNGDGKGDIAVSAIDFNSGKIYILSGADGSIIKTSTGFFEGHYGFSLANAGDTNNDGKDELLIGSPKTTTWIWFPFLVDKYEVGQVSLVDVSGTLFSSVKNWLGEQEYEHLGWDVAMAGDINEDNVDDVIMGAPGYDAAGLTDAGRILVSPRNPSAVPGGSNSDYFYFRAGHLSNMNFGQRVAGGLDLTADGIADVAASAPDYSNYPQAPAVRGVFKAYSSMGAVGVFDFDPNIGPTTGGTTVTFQGWGFGTNCGLIQISFDSYNASCVSSGQGELVVTTPAVPYLTNTLSDITINNPKVGSITLPDAFEYEFELPTGEKSAATQIVEAFSLQQNYPNPFNPVTTINVALPIADHVKLTIYDITGQQVATLYDGELQAGNHAFQWQAEDFASGMYLYRFESSSFTKTRRMILQK